jgi:hypothetical protein
MSEKKILREILVGETEVRMPLGRPRLSWNKIFKINLTEIALERVNQVIVVGC